MKNLLGSSLCVFLLFACGESATDGPEGESSGDTQTTPSTTESNDSESGESTPGGSPSSGGDSSLANPEGSGGQGASNENSSGGSTSASSGGSSGTPTEPLLTEMRSFIFGHSLLVHQTSLPVTPNETTVPHWMRLLANEAGYSYAADGQYGFLPQHSQLPPNPQWGFEIVPGVWDSEGGETFAEAGFNNVLLTAANFIQYQPATSAYDGDNPQNNTPLGETLKIVDWVHAQDSDIDIYVYENWPDMAGFLSTFPPTAGELENYYAYTEGDFHQWWLNYHDEIRLARPEANVRMVPVGPTMVKLLQETPLSSIPATDLYEDDAPHGRPTLYFLAALITYMGTYGAEPAASFSLPSSVHASVGDNLGTVVDFIWAELNDFEDEDGASRVW